MLAPLVSSKTIFAMAYGAFGFCLSMANPIDEMPEAYAELIAQECIVEAFNQFDSIDDDPMQCMDEYNREVELEVLICDIVATDQSQ